MRTLVWAIELGVGAACLAGGVAAMRSPGRKPAVRARAGPRSLRLAGILLLVAGAAAAGHALIRLAGQ